MTQSSLCICLACRRNFDYTQHIVDKPTNRPGVTQYGLRCPRCKFFVHTHYLDDGLRLKRDKLAQALTVYQKARNDRTWQKYEALRAEYQRAFDVLNPKQAKAT